MIALRLGAIADITRGRLAGPGGAAELADLVVDGPVVTDSREARAGSLYIARVGEHSDGHDFAAAAMSAGAVGALTTRPLEGIPCVVVDDVQEAFVALAGAVLDLLPDLLVIGITGSSGKTTTKDLLADVLAHHGETVANVGSLNSEVGVPLTICRVTPTTRHLVLEMGARGIGHIAYLTEMSNPRVGVVLNVGSAHVGEFGSREAIAQAKAELVQALPPGGLAVLNGDDPLVRAMQAGPEVRVVRVGLRADCDVRATDVTLDAAGAPGFFLHEHGESVYVDLAVVGEHQVGNALAVAAVALDVGMSLPEVAEALHTARLASRWRMERTDRPDGVVVLNDAYNANPESMASALHTLAHLSSGHRTWAVLGSMLELGADAATEHRRVGALAAELGIDELVVVGEGASDILEGAAQAGAAAAEARTPRARFVPDVDTAYGLLDEELRDGDVVLLKSSRDSGLRFLGDRLSRQENRP